VNLNIKQAAGNGKPQLQHPSCNWSTQTAIGAPACDIGHASGHGGELEYQAGRWQWKTTKGTPKLPLESLHDVILGHPMSLGTLQGMQVNLNIKPPAMENHKRSSQTTIGVPPSDFGPLCNESHVFLFL